MQINYMKYLLFISVCLIWGTTWLAMKIAVDTIPPITATGLRFLLTAPLLIILAKRKNVPLLFPLGQRKNMLIVSILYFSIPFWLMIQGEVYISAGLASIIFANMPVAVLIASIVMLGERFNRIQFFGLGMAVLSLIGIIVQESNLSGSNYAFGISALTIAVAIHAYMYVYTRKNLKEVSVLTFNALPSGMAAVMLLITGVFIESPAISHFTLPSGLAVIYLGIIAGVGGIVAYFKLNEIATPFQASTCFLVFPLIALLLDTHIQDSVLSSPSIILMLFLLSGIVMTKLTRTPIKQLKKVQSA